MLNIPFVKQPDPKSCALACSTMIAKYYFPETSFTQVAEISNWQAGYVVWTYKFWIWIMNQDIKITEYDLIDSKAWADDGIEGLKKSVSEKEFKYYVENSKDINSYSEDIKQVFVHKNFTYFQQKPSFEDLEKALSNGHICEVVLDSRNLRDQEGFSLHRVVILGIDSEDIVFHDPAVGPACRFSISKFKEAWLEAVSEPELCIYQNDRT